MRKEQDLLSVERQWKQGLKSHRDGWSRWRMKLDGLGAHEGKLEKMRSREFLNT